MLQNVNTKHDSSRGDDLIDPLRRVELDWPLSPRQQDRRGY